MNRMLLSAAVATVWLGVQPVLAQDAGEQATSSTSSNGTTFLGFRAEGQLGGDRFMSQGTHDNKIGFGGAIGWDGAIGDKIVIGPEFSYWRARDQNVTTDAIGGTLYHKSFQELGAGVRAGYKVTPQVLVYGIGGYVNNEQRLAYLSPDPTGAGSFYTKAHSDGYQLGAGAEYALTSNVYVGAGYRYSNYDDHTARQRLFLTAGVRFP